MWKVIHHSGYLIENATKILATLELNTLQADYDASRARLASYREKTSSVIIRCQLGCDMTFDTLEDQRQRQLNDCEFIDKEKPQCRLGCGKTLHPIPLESVTRSKRVFLDRFKSRFMRLCRLRQVLHDQGKHAKAPENVSQKTIGNQSGGRFYESII
jgi:hypothetical protein